MKILVIGDFHGKFPVKLQKKIKKEKFDLILSVGDFCGSDKWSKVFFKHLYAKSEKERKKVPRKIHKELAKYERQALSVGIDVLKKLKAMKRPFYGVHGNWDPNPYGIDISLSSKEEMDSKFVLKRFHTIFKKDFRLIDFKIKDLKDFVLVGGASSTYPGKIDKKSLRKTLKKYKEKDPRQGRKIINVKKRIYAFRKRKYEVAFKKAKKLKKPIVFLTHNCPYNTKLDVIRDKKAHELVKGEHYGSYLERLMINRFKPDVVICGHIHENFGKDKIGKSLIVNFGAAFENKAGIVEFNEKTKKFSIKFIK